MTPLKYFKFISLFYHLFYFFLFYIIKELNCTFCYRINGEIAKGEQIAKLQYVQVVVIKNNNIN